MNRAANASSPILALLVCSRCGTTAETLHKTGLMGCAHCYRTFAPLVIQAVQTLHGGGETTAPASPPPPADVPPDRGVLPWPTKRAAAR